MTRLGFRTCTSPTGRDVAGGHFAGAGLLQDHALRTLALHPDRDVLDVEDDVGHVLAHAGDRREFMQHAVDMDRGDRRALQRRQKNAAQRIAERHAETALQRLGDDGGKTLRSRRRRDFELVRLDELLPVLLNHESILIGGMRVSGAIARKPLRVKTIKRGGACAGGSRYAGSASRRGST